MNDAHGQPLGLAMGSKADWPYRARSVVAWTLLLGGLSLTCDLLTWLF